MHSPSDISSAEEERRHRASQHQQPAQLASSDVLPRTAKKRATASSSIAAAADGPAAYTPIRPSRLDSDLHNHVSFAMSDIPDMKEIPELLQDCKHLRQNLDGTPICEKQLEALQSGQSSQHRGIKREAPEEEQQPSFSLAPHSESAAAAASSSATVVKKENTSLLNPQSEDDLSNALRAALVAQTVDTKGHWVTDEFVKCLNRLPVPEFYDTTASGLAGQPTQEQLFEQLKRDQLHLPIQTSELEDELLQEAGTFVATKEIRLRFTSGRSITIPATREITFPPCRNGAKCAGMQPQYRLRQQRRNIIFTMTTFEDEYLDLLQTGRLPRKSRPCVQCSRIHQTQCVAFLRGDAMCEPEIRVKQENESSSRSSIAVDSALRLSLKGNEFRQWYANRCDQPGGYHKAHMLMNNSNPKDPLLEPLALPGRSLVVCAESSVWKEKTTGAPRLIADQSAIVWKAPKTPVPNLGENLLSFCGGASSY